MKLESILDVATTSIDDHIAPQGEIIDDQSMDADEKKVARKSLTRIRTRGGALEGLQLIGRKKELSEIIDLISNNDNS